MSATLTLKCREPILGFTGEALTEPDPEHPGQTRAIQVGRFLAQFVALGKGQPEHKMVECQSLALDLYREPEVPLSPEDVTLILGVLKRGFADGQIFAWVVGHFQYLLDPKSVPEATRERMAKHYAERPTVVSAIPAQGNGHAREEARTTTA